MNECRMNLFYVYEGRFTTLYVTFDMLIRMMRFYESPDFLFLSSGEQQTILKEINKVCIRSNICSDS